MYPIRSGQLVSVLGQPHLGNNYHYSAIEITNTGVIYFGQWIISPNSVPVVAASQQSFKMWYHLVLSYDGVTATAYVNGSSVGFAAVARYLPMYAGYNTWFGFMAADATNMGTYGYGNGRLGSVCIFNAALTSAQIRYHYISTSPF